MLQELLPQAGAVHTNGKDYGVVYCGLHWLALVSFSDGTYV